MPFRGLRAVPFLLFAWTSAALGHARLTSPTPRFTADDIKDSTGGLARCADSATTVPATEVQSGSVLRVEWDETVNHPGCFLFSLRQQPTGVFEDLANIKHSSAPPAPTSQNPRKYSADIPLPAVTCERCVLLMRQIMLGSESDPCPPASIPVNATYYSCADLRLVVAGTDGGLEADGGLPQEQGDAGVVDAGSDPGPSDGTDADKGCGCGTSGDALIPPLVMGVAALLLARRRRA